MKRALLGLAVLGVAAFLAGCPIYSNQSDYRVCTGSGCYDCPDPSYSSMCVLWSCNTDSDCGDGYACSADGTCGPISGDDASSPNDCSIDGCPTGETCKLVGGIASCVVLSSPSGADAGTSADATATDEASTDAPSSTDTSTEASVSADGPGLESSSPTDGAADGADTAPSLSSDGPSEGSSLPEASATIACNANGDCSIGASCIDGSCTLEGQLCSDGSQCAVAGDSCVNGICVPLCSAGTPCPPGYGCDFGLGVCDINPGPCTGSGTSSCQGGAVCVESRCVPPCSAADGAASCSSGQLCINGGCIPDEKAVFTCHNSGASGVLANTCAASSVCLHHDCYAECDGDGGGCPASQCKQVTVGANTYAVCGTSTTLGSDCDLAVGARCPASGVCVDGYCK